MKKYFLNPASGLKIGKTNPKFPPQTPLIPAPMTLLYTNSQHANTPTPKSKGYLRKRSIPPNSNQKATKNNLSR
jgi:hypothetical protein